MGEKELSSVEAELYDRQIRLWGIESQEKLRAANVLLIGIRGLGSEVAKDILLSGINSLTILDDGVVTEEELIKNFLLSRDSIGQKIAEAVLTKAQALNPLVKISSDTSSIDSKDEKFFSNFTIVISTGLNTDQILTISRWCRDSKVKFICGDVFGMFGYTIADFQDHDYYEDRIVLPKSRKRTHEGKQLDKVNETVKVQAKIQYPKINHVLTGLRTTKSKRQNMFYFLMLVLLEFRNKYKRDPLYLKKGEDVTHLKRLKDKVLEQHGIDVGKLEDEVLELVFGEVVPVCSIIGGVIAQEVIKAVSGKEVPINNVFILNPLTFSGQEETICNVV